MIDIREVTRRTNLSKSSIYDFINPKSKRFDPSFPKSIKISEHRVAWREREIDGWITSKRGVR